MPTTRKKIMVFDDDDSILEFCTFYFEEKGFDIQTASTCTDIVKKIEDFQPGLVIMDCWIPPNGGGEAVKTLREHHFTAPIIMFSANRDLKAVSEASGADAYLEKPFELNDLDQIVSRFLNTD